MQIEPKTKRIQLTPAYDLLSTLPYGDSEMALSLEGRKAKLRQEDFITWGTRLGIREKAIRESINRIVNKLLPQIDRISEIGLEKKKTLYLQKTIKERLKECL